MRFIDPTVQQILSESLSHTELERFIQEERDRARAQGLQWTSPREYMTPEETIGLLKCRCGLPECTIKTQWVSYSTRLPLRVAWCDGRHFLDKKKDHK